MEVAKSVNNGVMSRAWAIFRDLYRYPAIPFASIGRRCFAHCLRIAWAEHRAVADLAATPTTTIQARVEQIAAELEGLPYRGWGTDLNREHNRLNDELRPLARELLRRSLAASVALEETRAAEGEATMARPLPLAA